VLAERIGNELGVLHLPHRSRQRVGQGLDALGQTLLLGQLVEVGGELVGEVVALLDPLEAGVEDDREREVGVAGRVGRAELDPRRRLLAPLRPWHVEQRRAVVAGPRHVDRRLEPDDESLVRVHPLVGHRGDLAGVGEEPGDEALRHLRQVELVTGVVERVGVAFEQRQVHVHPGPLHRSQRLGHEGGVHAPLVGDLLHDHLERHDVVGHRQRVGVAQVDLVLAGRVLVVRVADGDAHRLQVQHRLLPEVAGDVGDGEVEVGPVVERLGRLRRVGVREVEVLDVGADVEGEALLPGPVEGPAQDLTGIAGERRAVQGGDVAEHAGDGILVAPPRQHLEGVRVGPQQRVALLHAGEPVDRGAVEAHALGEGVLQLGGGDRDRLQLPEHVGEPEEDEPHSPLFHRPQHVVLLSLHGTSFPRRIAPSTPFTERSHSGNGSV
jgi:hypothetical protein